MTPLLQIDNLTKSYGDRMLFADVSFGVNEGDKIGLIAKMEWVKQPFCESLPA